MTLVYPNYAIMFVSYDWNLRHCEVTGPSGEDRHQDAAVPYGLNDKR